MAWAGSRGSTARVRFFAPAEVVADRIPTGAGMLEAIDEQTCVLQTGSDSLHDLANYLGRLDVAFNVLEPPELRALPRDLADRYATAAR